MGDILACANLVIVDRDPLELKVIVVSRDLLKLKVVVTLVEALSAMLVLFLHVSRSWLRGQEGHVRVGKGRGEEQYRTKDTVSLQLPKMDCMTRMG